MTVNARPAFESPTARYERWPVLIMAAGWSILAVAGTIAGSTPPVLPPVLWITLAWIVTAGCIWIWVSSTPESRRFTMAVAIVVAAARSGAYIDQGAWAPLGVWTIVVGLQFSAYRLARELMILRRHLAECESINGQVFPDAR